MPTTSHPWLAPLPALARGDAIRIIAPSSAFDRLRYFRGLDFLGTFFRILPPLPQGQRQAFLAGDRQARLQELNTALRCPQAKALVAARGGAGATDLLGPADVGGLQRFPKWLIGYSDITALHLLWQTAGLPSLHADNVTGLGPADPKRRRSWLGRVLNPYEPEVHSLGVLRPGVACGPLAGGNLTVLVAALSEKRFRLPPGSILFLEDVAEPTFRLHRALRQLEAAGSLDAVSGLVLGDFTGPCQRDEVHALFAALARRLRVPCLAGLPAGHGPENQPLAFGTWAAISGAQLTLGVPSPPGPGQVAGCL